MAKTLASLYFSPTTKALKIGLILLIIGGGLSGCTGNELSGREKGALTGGALGSGLGAIVGHKTGSSGAGVAIGGVMGALAGGLIGNESDNTTSAQQAQDERLRRQDEELARQRRELEEIKNEKNRDTY